MVVYTYIVETNGKCDDSDPLKKFIKTNFPECTKWTAFIGDGKAILSITVDNKEVFKDIENTTKVQESDIASVSDVALTRVGFIPEKFIAQRAYIKNTLIQKEIT